MILARNIRYLRRQRNWSQDFVADKLGYKSYTTIQKWETGTSEPPLKKLKELADLFNVDINDLANKDLESHSPKDMQENYPVVTDKEYSIILKYRVLDEYGQQNVNAILNNEYARCQDAKVISLKEDTSPYAIHTLAAHEKAGASEEDKQKDYDLMNDPTIWGDKT